MQVIAEDESPEVILSLDQRQVFLETWVLNLASSKPQTTHVHISDVVIKSVCYCSFYRQTAEAKLQIQ